MTSPPPTPNTPDISNDMAQDDPLDGSGGDDARAEDACGDANCGGARPEESDGPDERHWLGVKQDYLHSGWAARRIAERHGISSSTLRARAKQFGWVRVTPMQRARGGPKWTRPPLDVLGPNGDELRRRRIVARLFKVLDAKMRLLEARMAEAVGGHAQESAADTERDARSITTLMQVYAKLVALDDAARARGEGQDRGQGQDQDGARTDDDADRLRRDLADRLARLSSNRDA